MSAAASASPAGPEASAAAFLRLKRAIIARTGHHYYLDKDPLLRDRLDRRLTATGCQGLPDYLSLLDSPAAGAAEWQELEAEITVGETFFFRHAEQFAALRGVVLPAILAENARRRTLRVWCAGCSVGAEPYSVAILLDQLLGATMARWTIDIVGSDISHRALAQAREGRFSNWALRGMPDADRARDFTADADLRHWRIADRHRQHVRFRQHNLLSLLDDAQHSEWEGFDLILCRNVLIYFSRDRIVPMLEALARCLGPAGWLMVGHSDAIATLPRDLGVVELPGTVVFRPPSCVAPGGVSPSWAWPAQEAEAEAEAEAGLVWTRSPAPPKPAAETPAAETPAAAEPPVEAIRRLADAGRLQAAAEACAAAIAAFPLDPRLHFYDGVIAQESGQPRRAEAALRRAIYLSGDMVMAHYHLGLLLLDAATPEAGRRVMAQVLTLCEALPETAVLPESDGLGPRDLIERVAMRLRPRHPVRKA